MCIQRQARALLVEDHAALRGQIARRLAAAGFEVVEAAGVAEAVASMREGPLQLVVCDDTIADGRGIDVLWLARRVHANCVTLLLSVLPGPEAPRFADGVLSKPPDPAKLAPFIERARRLVRRRHVRHRVEAAVISVVTQDDPPMNVAVCLVDVSRSGVGFLTRTPLAPKTALNVAIDLGGAGSRRRRAETRWCRMEPGGWRVGAVFTAKG